MSWQKFRSYLNTPLLISSTLILLFIFGSFLVPLFSQWDPELANPREALSPPSWRHPFGTDRSGMDIFVRVFHAPRIDLSLVSLGVLIGGFLGILIGVITGFARGLMAEIVMRLVDVIQAFPLLILAITLVGLAGNDYSNIVIVLAFVNVPVFVRLTRSQVLTLRELRFVEASLALGNSKLRLIMRHILPNSLAPAVVQFGISMGYGVLTLAGMAFLGVGIQAPTPEWGSMILTGTSYITTGEWWISVFPGLILAIAIFSFNLLSEGVELLRERTSR
ncbi:MAG TPA: peptide ABC transporter permease [Deltaproteobacteria bacterium]|nr:peptide ABC transporter permease [Deltaproteobacteria bacterium]